MSQPSKSPPSRTDDSRLHYHYPSAHPHPSDYYYHYYPPPPYHPPTYIGPPPPSDKGPKRTPSSEGGLKAFYSQQYDIEAFTPHPPVQSARNHRATPPTITPHDWIPEGLSTPRRTTYFEASDLPAVTESGSSESTESSKSTQNRPVQPARSAFMCFMQAKRGENTNEAAEAWRLVSKEERAHWGGVANKDRKRYNKERSEFNPSASARKVRRKKDPSAPKRPMSAFLMYAQNKRRQLQAENPDIPNADISRMLGEHWRCASPDEKKQFLEREAVERRVYRAMMEGWKCDQKLAKSLAPKVNITTKRSAVTERYDQRQDDEESLARRGEESATRYAPPPNINEFGAVYPTEAAYHYPPYGGYHCGDRRPLASPTQTSNSVSKHWGGSYNPIDSGIKYSYPRPDEEGRK